jgi:hypothetical protein
MDAAHFVFAPFLGYRRWTPKAGQPEGVDKL